MLHVTVSKPVVNLTENLYYMCDILQVLCKCNVVRDYSIAFSVHSPGIMLWEISSRVIPEFNDLFVYV